MKKYLRLLLFNFVSLWITSFILEGVGYLGGYQTLAIAAGVLTLVNLLVKPLVNILLLPINLITLGTFRWLINVITLYLVTVIVPQFKIVAFKFTGSAYQGFIIPQIYISTFWAFVLASFVISLITSFLLWLTK